MRKAKKMKRGRAKPSAQKSLPPARLVRKVMASLLPPGVVTNERGQTCIAPSKIQIGKRHRKDLGDLDALARSIDERNGLLHPLPVRADLKLIAGERRLRAWQRTKFAGQPIPITIVDVDSIVKGEWDENAPGIRKDFTPSEAVAIKAELEPLYKAAAEQRRREHGKTAPGKGSAADRRVAGRAADQVGKIVGMDRRTLDKAADIVAAAKANPEKFGPLKEQMDRTGKVAGPHKRMRVLKMDAEIRKAPSPLPMQGPYAVMAADAPWPGEIDDPDPAGHGRAYYPYATMSLAAIAAMGEQVKAITKPDSWLWFWIPNHHLAHGCHIPILKAWDYEPVAIVTWFKPHFGNGKIIRGQTEQLLLCRRGKPAWTLTNQSTKLEGPASDAHSSKPESFFTLAETLTPAARYGYLFAGGALPANWDGHGDRVGKLPPGVARAAEAEMLAKAKAAPAAGELEKFDDELANVLAAIERGEEIAAKTVKKLKLAALGYVSDSGKKLKLKAAGRTLLQARREDLAATRAEAAKLAALPDDLDGLVALYRTTLERRHAAVLAGEETVAEELAEMLDLLQAKANGGTSFGMAIDDSPAERLRVDTAAPIGTAPMWGQRGLFQVDVEGVPYICCHDEDLSFAVHAADPDKPFISNTGYQSFAAMGEVALGCTVEQQFRAYIDEYLRHDDDGATGKLKKRKQPLPLPDDVYALPASWAGAKFGEPLRVSKKKARGALSLPAPAAIAVEPTLPIDMPATPPCAELAAGPPRHACDVRKQVDAPILAAPHYLVRVESHPALWQAFDTISHDSGAGCGYPGYPVPERWADGLISIDAALAKLTADELQDFAIGEFSDHERLKARDPALERASDLLVAFFEGFPTPEPPSGTPADQLDIPAYLRRTSDEGKHHGRG